MTLTYFDRYQGIFMDNISLLEIMRYIMYKNVLAVYKNGKCIIKSKRIDATITKMMT